MTLYEGIQEIYKRFGCSREGITSFTLEGKEGLEKIRNVMKVLRDQKQDAFGDIRIIAIRDYLTGLRYENGWIT